MIILCFAEFFTDCNFDLGECANLLNMQTLNTDADFQWTRGQFQTPTGAQTQLTGPSSDRSGSGT